MAGIMHTHLAVVTTKKQEAPLVAVVMGSDSDLSIMKGAIEMLIKFEVPYCAAIMSAHRTPETVSDFAKDAEANGLKAIIAGAGMSAALPGCIAAHTTVPVIGVPISAGAYTGDSLLAMAQMPPGIPVATVAINGAANAAILAAEIIGTGDENVRKKLWQYKDKMKKDVYDKNTTLQEIGYQGYLELMAKNKQR